ncbi:phosphate ABC transporter membrane protein 2 (PhoT family) [Antricoccus suffuscus]|uniref:Phosphate transport system permease protein PstA n=1 Tax=Antricoccus suffuscus TaxID=1629062 RepID=A0A2T1A1A3_9ACTN|nr:phosphate ABC transporter permease PstA [Antricoccus suffuscus]PRZ42385.1 phosphate ABC transporter membrane protein 2 (PhoT family) [Antricoccus suffuscus]
MTTPTQTARATKPGRDNNPLRGRKLPQAVVVLLPIAVLLLTLGLFSITGLQGYAGYVVTALVLYLIVQSVVSFAYEGPRQARDRLATTLIYVAFALAMLPLVLILAYTLARGLRALSGEFLTHSMFTISSFEAGGGATHAILGTIYVSLIAAVFAVPLGILTAIYLVEYGGRTRFGKSVSFFVDVMTGVPSIVSGLFIYTFWLLTLGFSKTAFAGALSLVLLMLPIVVRSTEEMLKLVPTDLREASYALGIPKWRTIIKVVLPTALSGIITGVMLGVARIMGETAPLLLLVGSTPRINADPFNGQMSTLPTFINQYFGLAAGNAQSPNADRAWAAALTLILLIMAINLAAKAVARFTRAR